MRMRMLMLVGVITLFCSCLLPAQDSEPKKNSLQEGMWALQFQVSQNFTLASFQGSTISLKRQYSPNVAIRLGSSINLSSSTSATGFLSMPDSFIYYSQNAFGNSQNISVTAQYLRYPDPIAGVNLFFGAGPVIGFGRAKDVREQIQFRANTPVDRDQATDLVTNWSLGLSMAAGVEWFASTSISISAEYGSSLLYSWRKMTRTRDPFTPGGDLESKNSSFGFLPSKVLFGLSAYF